MRLVGITITLWLLYGPMVLAAEPFARAKLEDTGRIVPGQQVLVDVEVLVPDFFTSPPQFPLFDLPNAIVTLPDDRAQNMVETIDGVQYAGIRRTYAVVPETSGTFTLPPAVITLGYSQDGKPIAGQTTLPSTSFTVEATPGGTTASLTFAARGLTIEQSFDRDPSTLRTGDALVRTITVFAENTQAMMIPEVPAATATGLKQYSKPPKIADGVQAEDRTMGSSRTETITYIAEAEGTFEIPAVSYPWCDLDTQATEHAELPAMQVTVSKSAPAPTGLVPKVEEADTQLDRKRVWRQYSLIAAALFALAVVGYLTVRAFPWARRRWFALRNARQHSSKRKLKYLLASVLSDDPMTVYRSLDDWTKSAGYGSIGQWVAATGDKNIARETEKLERELFGSSADHPSLNRTALAAAIRSARADRSLHVVRRASSLPALNVSAADA
ncbi:MULTISPECIES: BatD family protein [unclassified Rhizobium]|uniref:BatD family protein n=1 Tax=unclassified Rhizobium TaxID=2613769 RepID=UPI0006F72033|nr:MULTISPECIES: BatD family protein [unclassified Rhizobium]KQV41741.1 hypothetical protein ASC86_20205 [Rhizobium sp. Root1212]KRD32257.1 hypothetical protein ASE37_22845 [Rhizobium sp. Root268]